MRGEVANFALGGHHALAVGDTDRFAHAEVAGDDARPPQRARQNPFRSPHADSAERHQLVDNRRVGERHEPLQAYLAARDRLRHGDDIFGLAIGELERANLGGRGVGQTLGAQAVNDRAADDVLVAEALRKPPARLGRPSQIDLLCADTSHERDQQIRAAAPA